MTPELIQTLMGAAVVGLVADHIRIRSVLSGYVTHDRMERMELKMETRFTDLSKELQKIAGDLQFLRGQSEHAK